jgi:V/A-type H+-transporting ATPase subunit E
MSEDKTIGVQQLIDRISDEGVAEGHRQAEKIVADAQQKADDILDSARREANEILKHAREEADKLQAAGEEALQLAARDAVRDFGARIHDGLRNRLQELVHHELQQPELIKRMILEITGEASKSVSDQRVEILLPPEIVSEDEARKRAEAGEPDELMKFVEGLVGQRLREGVSVNLGSQNQSGVTVRVVEQNVEIDLTDEAITELLARHMLPRFRAVMRKVQVNPHHGT